MLNDSQIKRLGWGIFFISISILLFELSLVRLFSVVLFPSLAFFAVTLVFFGLTLGGLIVYFFSSFFSPSKFNEKSSILSVLYALSLFIYVYLFISIDPTSTQAATLKLIWLSAIPITLANVYLAYVFANRASNIGQLYSFDLVGAGMGTALCVVLLSYLSPIFVIIIGGFFSLVGSLIATSEKKQRYAVSAVLILSFIFFIGRGQAPDLKYTKKGAETNVIFSKWNSFSRIALRTEEEKRFLYSLPSPDIQKVDQLGIEIDADAYTSTLRFDGDLTKLNFLKKDLSGLAYHLVSPGKALIIGPGGGRDVLMALIFGNKVNGADINPIIINDLMKGRLKEYSGNLYLRADVDIKIAEGRSFIKKDQNKYNSINLPLVDTWASTAGGNLAIVEGYLYTVEAIEDYLSHLEDDGILTISRWSVDGTKLVTMYLKASEQMDIKDPAKNIIIIGHTQGEVGLYNYMFKKSPFTQKEIATAERFLKDNQFSNIYIPGKPIINEYNDLVSSSNWLEYAKNYKANIIPATDDKPFFFFTLPISKLIKFEFVSSYLPDGGLGTALRFSLVFTLICLLLPIIFSFKDLKGFTKDAGLFLSYFFVIGFSFMLIEISLIQKFILYLEYPIYSYSVVIATLLICAGFGSFVAQRKEPNNLNFKKIASVLVLFFLIYISLISSIINATIGMDIFKKIILAIIINTVPAFLMGMMMPLGIKRLDLLSMSRLIPWCWAVNGSASILASVGAVLLALLYGFRGVTMLGAMGYILAFILISRTGQKQISSG